MTKHCCDCKNIYKLFVMCSSHQQETICLGYQKMLQILNSQTIKSFLIGRPCDYSLVRFTVLEDGLHCNKHVVDVRGFVFTIITIWLEIVSQGSEFT